MRFWDSSALVALFVEQRATPRVRALHAEGRPVVAWTFTEIEIRSAFERLMRAGLLDRERALGCMNEANRFWRKVRKVSAIKPVRTRALGLLAHHPLRSLDALQLGAALVAAEDDPASLDLVCLDGRLADAARREGFVVVP